MKLTFKNSEGYDITSKYLQSSEDLVRAFYHEDEKRVAIHINGVNSTFLMKIGDSVSLHLEEFSDGN